MTIMLVKYTSYTNRDGTKFAKILNRLVVVLWAIDIVFRIKATTLTSTIDITVRN